MAPYLIACSMQHVSTVSTYPGSCKTCFSHIPVFGRNFLLIFSIIYQIAHLHNWPTWPDYPFDLCLQVPWMGISSMLVSTVSTYPRFDQFTLKFHWVKTCFGCIGCIDITNWYLSDLIMPKPVSLMTVQEAHKECNSLIDQIRAKYQLLDSGECGSVGTPAFNAKCSKLAHLMARMSELCKHLNLPMPKEFHKPPYFKHWSALNSKLFFCGRFS